MVVHTSDCPNISELRKQPDRCLMVDWDENLNKDFHVKLQVRVKHVSGAFAKVATAIAENGSNINNVDTQEGVGDVQQIYFNIDVKNRVQLATIIKAIRKQADVVKVVRQKG